MAPICVLRDSIEAKVFSFNAPTNAANACKVRLVIYNKAFGLGSKNRAFSPEEQHVPW